ncbi:hypothetical protein PG990_002955 [Apiospora arundinis]
MLKSRLLFCNLLIGLATIQAAWARDGHNRPAELFDNHTQTAPEKIEAVIWERVQYIIVERESAPKRIILETLPSPTALPARDVRCLQMPKPTPAPQKRQDQGQINALSGEIQRLSGSISQVSQTASSISQSAQSVKQSADQAVRSANQNADQANQALSRTQSSASSAISQASQQANDRIAQASSSMSSSFSSQVSVNLASVQSSASSDISVASASASRSAASAMNIAASQIQQARADASGIRGDANNLVAQVQSNSISAQNLAIIVSVSVVGSVIVTAIIAFFVMRCRRKGRKNREAAQGNMSLADEKTLPYDDSKPIAVQGIPPTAEPTSDARFDPKTGGTYPMDKLKLPGFSPFTAKKEAFSNVGMATSDYGEGKIRKQTIKNDPDVYGVSSQSFRLQKPPSVSRAETVRIIRVNSRKKEEQEQPKAEDKPPAQEQTPAQAPAPAPVQTTPVQRKSAPRAPSQQWPEPPSPAPKSPLPPIPLRSPGRQQSPQQPYPIPPRSPLRQQSQQQQRPIPPRSPLRQKPQQQQQQQQPAPPLPVAIQPPPSRDSARYSMITPKTPEFGRGAGERSDYGWRPPSTRRSARASIISAAARFKFRDSSDMESDAELTLPRVPKVVAPTVAVAKTSDEAVDAVRPPKGGVSMMSMMSSQGMGPSVRPGGSPERPGAPAIPTLRKSSEVLDREPMIPSLLPPPIINPAPVVPAAAATRTRPSFATFPTVRKQGPPASMPPRPQPQQGPMVRTSAEFFGAGPK